MAAIDQNRCKEFMDIRQSAGLGWPLDDVSFSHCNAILPRDAMLSAVYATAIPSVCPSVHHRRALLCIKTAECIIKILSLSDRPIILVFRHQGLFRKSDGFTPNGGAQYKG